MKKLLILSALALLTTGLYAQSVKFSSAMPEAGKPLSFEYDPAGSKVEKLADVKCTAYTFINRKQKVIPVTLTREGSIYKGSLVPADSTSILVLAFSSGDTRDDNPAGYYTLFYKNGLPTAMSYYWESQFYNGMGAAFAGARTDKTKAVASMEKAFAMDPSMKSTYIISYLSLQYGIDKERGAGLIAEQIKMYNAKSEVKEQDLMNVSSMYNILKRKPASDSVLAIVKSRFPGGNYAYGQAMSALFAEKNAAKKEEKAVALISNFKLDPSKNSDVFKLNTIYSTLASAYGLANNNEKFTWYTSKINDKVSVAGLNNSYAWASAEKKVNLEFAAAISKKSLEFIESAKLDPVPDGYVSSEDYLQGLDDSYASYADTYALLLHHLGNHAEAVKYQEQAVIMNGFIKPDMNERYVSFLMLNGDHANAAVNAEKFLRAGTGTEKMTADLKSLYKGNVPFDTYLAGVQKDASDKEEAKWRKEMINMPAPTFTLVNLKGQKTDLAKLKGKVVIVDYWATWCGPCIASFPGMQKAVEKYKNDPNVVFLFVNTWQTEENREKVVSDWVAANPAYTFNVLLDTKNKQDPSKFDVIEQYKVTGIPTKFIIDGNGNIRFRKVGFSGTADGVVKELDMMISMAKGTD